MMHRLLATGVMVACLSCSDSGPASPTVAKLEAVSPATQKGAVAGVANFPPAVRALTSDNQPVVGALIEFAAPGTAGMPVHVATDTAGIARLAVWSLGSTPGAISMEARYESLPLVHFDAQVVQRSFDVVFRLIEGDLGPGGAAALAAAEAKIESIIFGDLSDEPLESLSVCALGGNPPAAILNETVDDLLILVRVRTLDGPGGGGGTGMPCLIRDPGMQTIVGLMTLDVDDWNSNNEATMYELFLHETFHILGFSPAILNRALPSGFTRHCLELPSKAAPDLLIQDTHLSCPNARAAFDALGGAAYSYNKVPLENGGMIQGTQGSLNAHWREATFGTELMSAYFQLGGAPLSLLTVRLLQDLDYEVSFSAAESYLVPQPLVSLRASSSIGGRRLFDADMKPHEPVVLRVRGSR